MDKEKITNLGFKSSIELFIILFVIIILKIILKYNISSYLNLSFFYLFTLLMFSISTYFKLKFNNSISLHYILYILTLVSIIILLFNFLNQYTYFIILSIILFGILSIKSNNKETKVKSKSKKQNNILFIVLFLITIIITFYTRIWNLNSISFWFDELLHIATVQGIHQHFIPTYESGAIYGRGFIISYLIYIYSIFTPITENARLVIVLFSLLTIPLIYLICRNFYGKYKSILFTLIININPIIIIMAQEVRYFIILTIAYLLFIYILFNEKIKNLYKIPILFILFFIGENSSIIILPLFIFSVLFHIILNIKNPKEIILFINKKSYTKYLLILSTVICIALFYIINEIFTFNYFNKANMFAFHDVYFFFINPLSFTFFCLLTIFLIFNYQKIVEHKKIATLNFSIMLFITILSILNTKFSGDIRHVIFLTPIFILNVLYIVDLFSQKIKIKSLSIVIFMFLLLILQIPTISYFQSYDSHLEFKTKYTWTRPDYKQWKEINLEPNSIILSNVPHIAEFYVGRVDYKFEPGNTNGNDYITGVNKIATTLQLTDKCIYIFSDYKSKSSWSNNMNKEVNKYFDKIQTTRYTTVYLSKTCTN